MTPDTSLDQGTVDQGTVDTASDTAAGKTPVGGPCTSKSQCVGGDKAGCVPEKYSDGSKGFPGGYCVIFDCSESAPCPAGSACYQSEDEQGNEFTVCLKTCDDKSDCRPQYVCESFGACWPGCTSDADCGSDEVCGQDGVCKQKPCTEGSCGQGYKCVDGQCVPDVGAGPGPGPGPDCPDLPPKDCTGTPQYCGELVLFEPLQGPGYDNYPLNGECAPCTPPKKCNGNGSCTTSGTLPDQYRSYLRRDTMMLVKYAAAYVECKAKSWTTGNGKPIGLGDMSEQNGAIPGTSIGEPGHPQGTHTNGFDIDMAYFQTTTADNHLRPVCEHTVNGKEAYHCTKAPDILDLWRTTLYIGALLTSSRTRVIGVDGKIGPLIEAAMPTLCAGGWLPQTACNKVKSKLAYEVTDQGYGWYYFHHHHMHLSTWNQSREDTDVVKCITEDCLGIHAGPPVPTWDLYREPQRVPRLRLH